ncbi:BC1872 family protein [Paenibacillus polymyxa]|uniref:BC1872 family protein n=1 Tax=Paenibacillus polymyxa TaxID=1406 RepID=UPI00129B69D4|nr:hypothetical protein [Paenibacillus polymyxa]KAE8560222.1 hypothetical protein BJH92_10095 [Paenibacillus polymyxa]MCJ1221244.1 hypothetical protein [Paenibacillus polymyxa]
MELTREIVQQSNVGSELDALVGKFVTLVSPEIKWWVTDDAETIIYEECNYESDARDALNKLMSDLFDTSLLIVRKEIHRSYSTSVAEAWRIVELFKARGYLSSLANLVGGKWEFRLTDYEGMCKFFSAQAETPEEAICRAALVATLRKQKSRDEA